MIFSAIVTGYGRGISEVGAIIIVGGNINGKLCELHKLRNLLLG
ncbi:hypothetical protein [Alkaliphilus sp. B6464]|nr:hypothetical protein [Alkaliphilus sp. B6464]